MPESAEQHVAGLSLLVNGQELDPVYRDNMLEVRVRETLSVPASALIRINDPQAAHVDSHPLQLGASVEIKMGAPNDPRTTTVFKGEVVAWEPDFAREGCTIAVRAYDLSHRLQRGSKVRTFQKMKASDMVSKICSEAGLAAGKVEPTEVEHEYYQQSGETDRDFIRRFERAYDYEFVVDDQKFDFRKAGNANGAPVPLRYGDNLLSFRPRVSATQQLDSTEVRGWDAVGKREITARGSTATPSSTPGVSRGTALSVKASSKSLLVADRTVESTGEATAIANAALRRRADAFVEAEGQCSGNPGVRAGKQVQISQVGSKFSGTYYVSAVQHSYRGKKGYMTSFEIAGRSPRGLLDLVHPPAKRDWGAHLVVGLVTNTDDANSGAGGIGRVKVKFPSLADQNGPIEGAWARIATVSAGGSRGLMMMPHVGDEVVVAFENGDPRRPIVLGAVFSNSDKPTKEMIEQNSSSKERGTFAVVTTEKAHLQSKDDFTIKSDKKLILQVQTDVEEKVSGKQTSETTGEMKTKTNASYTLEAGSSLKIKAANIEIEASGSIKLKGLSVDIEAQTTAALKANASLDIQSSGMTNVKGSMVNIG
jgi:phage protein D/phage baseplate assembly protein gpV